MGGQELAKSPVVTIHSITLVSDTPVPGGSARVVTPYLYQRIEGAKKSLLIENFMFMVKGEESTPCSVFWIAALRSTF